MASVRVEGLISFGLVSVPIRLLSAARAPHVNFMKFIGSAARVFTSSYIVRTTNASYRETKLQWGTRSRKIGTFW